MDSITNAPVGRTLIFVKSKRAADALDKYLNDNNIPATSIHGDRNQAEREDALLGFKKGVTPIMVATNVAARGLDIKDVLHVINYDLPGDIDEYVHRIGRTARAGNTGNATSFYTDRDDGIAYDLVKLLKSCKQEIPHFLKRYETNDIRFDEVDDKEIFDDGDGIFNTLPLDPNYRSQNQSKFV